MSFIIDVVTGCLAFIAIATTVAVVYVIANWVEKKP